MSLRVGITVALVLAILGSAPAAAGPRKRVAVVAFAGPSRAAAQKAVVKALKRDGFQVVVRKAGARERDDDAVAAIARGARATAVVLGTLQKEGKRRVVLSLAVHTARSGARIEEIEVPLRNGRVDARAQRAIARGLGPAVAKGEPATAKGEPAAAKGEKKTALAAAPRASAQDDGATVAVAPAPPPAPTARAAQAADDERPKR